MAKTTSLLCAAAVALGTGCGYEPGDYIVFRVNLSAAAQSDGCYYPDDGPDPGEEDSSNSQLAPATWVLYFAPGDRVVLDTQGGTLTGETADEGFGFVGYAVDTSYLGVDQEEAKVTQVQETTVQLDIDGDVVSGEHQVLTEVSCEYLVPTPSVGCTEIPDCRRKREVHGVVLDDVEVESGVDRPNPI
jgi:hypothetical protein